MASFIQCKYTVEELEQFRDEEGYIDLTKAGIVITPESREQKGTAERLKNWIDIGGKKYLLRGEAVENYSNYAELIAEEIAREAGVENAHYDLMKITNSDGEIVHGVMSESIIDNERESLISLHEIIGDEPEEEIDPNYDPLANDPSENFDYITTTHYDFTIEAFEQRLREGLSIYSPDVIEQMKSKHTAEFIEKLKKASKSYDENFIQKILSDYKKRLIFSLLIGDSDKHPENISFILSNNGDGALRIAPNYDNEFSLLLENSREYVQFLSGNSFNLEDEVDNVDPKIATFVPESEGGNGSAWRDTLEALTDDDEILDYLNDILDKEINMDKVIGRVEARIHARLPEPVKKVAIGAFKTRISSIEELIGYDLEEEKSDVSLMDFVNALRNIGKNSEK